ncbi:hypothetical protein UlMin_028951 [Ulmus minor]
MGRAPCCDKANVKKGPWSPEEDSKLREYIEKHGTGGNWIALPQKAGLKRCGKSCRLRWLNYLRPNIKHGEFSDEEDRIICSLFATIGSRWSIIAAQLPGRTDNDIKNYWNTKLKKKLMGMVNSSSQKKQLPPFPSSSSSSHQNALSFPSQQLYSSPLYKGYNSYNYTTQTPRSFSSLSSLEPNMLNLSTPNFPNTTSSSLFQTQDQNLVVNTNPIHHQYYPVKENLLMFGSEGSCSTSSDGSCNQISYGSREIKQEEQIMGFTQNSYFSNGFEEHNQRFMVNYNGNGGDNLDLWGQKPNGYSSETLLDYGFEDFKNLIISSSTNSTAINGSNTFFNI